MNIFLEMLTTITIPEPGNILPQGSAHCKLSKHGTAPPGQKLCMPGFLARTRLKIPVFEKPPVQFVRRCRQIARGWGSSFGIIITILN